MNGLVLQTLHDLPAVSFSYGKYQALSPHHPILVQGDHISFIPIYATRAWVLQSIRLIICLFSKIEIKRVGTL